MIEQMAKRNVVLAGPISVMEHSGGAAFRLTQRDTEVVGLKRGQSGHLHVEKADGKMKLTITAEWPVDEKPE